MSAGLKLRGYQREANNKALSLMRGGGGFGLWLEQRTGKSPTALSIVAAIKPKHLWIICPKGAGAVLEMWEKQIEQWSHLFPSVFDDVGLRIMNYEQVVTTRKHLYKEARTLKDLFIIVDEAHYIKSRGSARSRTVRHLGRSARWRLALTGTPIAQGIQDAWALFDFIDPAIFGPWDDQFDGLIRTHIGFDSKYLVWGGFKKNDVVAYNNEDEFNELFHRHSYRCTLREVRQKSLIIRSTIVPVELSLRARRAYEELKRDLLTEINRSKVKVKNVISCLIKLQQITGGAVIAEPNYTATDTRWMEERKAGPTIVGHEKLNALHRIARSLPSRTKFIVIARFVHEIDRIAKSLQQLGLKPMIVRGGMPYDNKFAADCVVMQIQSGVAVDMSHADHVVFYSIDFSMINFEQARFRALNYDKPFVHYHFIQAINTVDEDIHFAVTRKRNVARFVCDVYRNKWAAA